MVTDLNQKHSNDISVSYNYPGQHDDRPVTGDISRDVKIDL